MLKKVSLTNAHSGRTEHIIVETDSDDKAIIGAGKAANESAKVKNIEGLDAVIQGATQGKASIEDRATLFRGVSRCLERNISTIKSFTLQSTRMKSPRYRGAIAEISAQVSSGEKVSDAMAGFPDLFGADVLALMRAGEEAGQLPEVCSQLAKGQKKTLKIIKKLKAGMIYPAIVFAIALGVIIVMSFTLIPAMSKLYLNFGSELPLVTKGMMALSDALLKYPFIALIPFVVIGFIFKKWGAFYSQHWVQKMFVSLPTVGVIIRKASGAVSFRTLAMLMESNVRIGTALKITSEASPHIYHTEFFSRVSDHVLDGASLPESFLMESHWLGADGRNISGLVEISAESGSSTDLLNELADDYEEDLDTIAGQIDKMLEPITIVLLGGMVATLLYAIYAPILGLGDVILPKSKEKPVPTAISESINRYDVAWSDKNVPKVWKLQKVLENI